MNIISKERVDEIVDYLTDERPTTIFPLSPIEALDALVELSELRSIVANGWRRDGDFCRYCDAIQPSPYDSDGTTHSPDCIVSRYTAYRKEGG